VPRTQRSAQPFAISAFMRVFDALWRCAAEPGFRYDGVRTGVPALRSGMKNAAPRPGHEFRRNLLLCRAGLTTAPAPTTASSPMRTPGRMIAPPPQGVANSPLQAIT
jgi:hypothetical protein